MTKDWVHGVDHSTVCQILSQIVRVVITSSPPAWTSSAAMSSTLADFPFFNDCTAASTSLRRMGWSSFVSVWEQFSTDRSPLALWLYSSEQYLSLRYLPERSWTVVAFPFFTVVKSFTSWYALLLFFLRLSSISLHCSPIQFSLAFFMHLHLQREALWLKKLYNKATSAVLLNGSIGDWFRTTVGVRQGCLLSPTLFNIFLERITTDTLEDHEGTVGIKGRTIANFRFSDDIDGLAGEEEELANLVERLDKASTAYGMEISAEKTKLMTNNTSGINTEI